MSIASSYVSQSSLIHRLDVRLKIGFLLALSWLVFAAAPPTLFYVGVFIVLAFLGAGAGVRIAARSLKPALPIFGVIILVHTLGGELGDAAGGLGRPSLAAAYSGLLKGALLVVRFSLLIMASTILTRTSSPLAITAALEALLSPLKALRLPTNALAQALALAVRFLPLLLLELEDIKEAQKARGMDMGRAPIKRKFYSARLTSMALLNNTLVRVEAIADAMAARGYNSTSERTRLRPLLMQKWDYLLMFTALGAAVLAAAWAALRAFTGAL